MSGCCGRLVLASEGSIDLMEFAPWWVRQVVRTYSWAAVVADEGFEAGGGVGDAVEKC